MGGYLGNLSGGYFGNVSENTTPMCLCCVRPRTGAHEFRDTPKRFPKLPGDAMLLQRMQEAKASDEAFAKGPIEKVVEKPLMSLPLQCFAPGKWNINGMYEEQVLKVGLRLLDEAWDTTKLLEFPRRKDGSNLLFRQRLVEDLINGNRNLKEAMIGDISAMQGDLVHLTLRQLLRIRVSHLNFKPSGPMVDTQIGFIEKLDTLLFLHLGRSAINGENFETLEPRKYMSFGSELVRVVAAAAVLPQPEWWVRWVGSQRVFFHPNQFTCDVTFPGSVFEIVDASHVDHNSRGQRWLDWKVKIVHEESELAQAPLVPSAAQDAAASYGANINAPCITEAELALALQALVKAK